MKYHYYITDSGKCQEKEERKGKIFSEKYVGKTNFNYKKRGLLACPRGKNLGHASKLEKLLKQEEES